MERSGEGSAHTRMVLGLGSNLGDRAANIEAAARALGREAGMRVLAASPLYETPPAGGPPQGDYLNGAVLVEAAVSPREVLSRCLAVERSLGRVRPDPVRWGPRTIDVDVLWIEGRTLREPELIVPHPRLVERPFAVQPLVDVAPFATDPISGEAYRDVAAARMPLRRVADPPRVLAR
ncbi:MAG: 2-amino-4-hydroxy-6-hydroxymethyldihydropteridine diphosphokinase [Polyangiaceae bacterium]